MPQAVLLRLLEALEEDSSNNSQDQFNNFQIPKIGNEPISAICLMPFFKEPNQFQMNLNSFSGCLLFLISHPIKTMDHHEIVA